MKFLSKNNPNDHRQKIKAQMREFIDYLRPDVENPAETRHLSLFETSAEELPDLATAFDDYEKKCEVAWRTELMASRPNERTADASRRL
jgi:hypothetical protein